MDNDQNATNEREGEAPTLTNLMTEDKVAALLGKKKRWLQQNRHRGRNTIPYVKVGRTPMYEPSEVARYMKQRRFNSTSHEVAEKALRQDASVKPSPTR